MRSKITILLLLAISAAFFQCKKTNDFDSNPDPAKFNCNDYPVVCDLTTSNGVFAIDLFKKLQEDEPDGNIFISPFSISTALTMTANGARESTLEDMRNTLRIAGLSMPSVNEAYQQLLKTLPALDQQTKLKLANSIWPQKDYPVLTSFLNLNKEYFDSDVIPVNFRDPGVIDQVNIWVDNNTDGLIEEAVEELPAEVKMLLINAIYFKGAWKTSFDPEYTHPATFYGADDTTTVEMMNLREAKFPYFENDLLQAIDLPYGDSIFSMSIFLPKEDRSLEEVMDELTPANLSFWLSNFQNTELALVLPKFKLEYGKMLKRPLSSMGMGQAFGDSADFSNMVENGGVKISDVVHKAVVEVDEKGAEAAAVTVVIIEETSVKLVPVFRANRPFFFLIRDNKTNSILFMGKVLTLKD